jgi:hypothetical protein
MKQQYVLYVRTLYMCCRARGVDVTVLFQDAVRQNSSVHVDADSACCMLL